MVEFHVGQVVISKQGRDRGKHYLIAKTGDECCALVDGGKRTFARPKSKNYKHLQGTLIDSGELGVKMAGDNPPQDSDVRGFLKRLSREMS